jgi:hypothetical protein
MIDAHGHSTELAIGNGECVQIGPKSFAKFAICCDFLQIGISIGDQGE